MKSVATTSILLVLLSAPAAEAARVATFDNLTLPDRGYWNGDDAWIAAGKPVPGQNGVAADPNPILYDNTIISGGVRLGNVFESGYYADWNWPYTTWAGWAVSNKTDTTTPGIVNQYSAITGTGVGRHENYGIGYVNWMSACPVTLPAADTVAGMYITNTTYVYRAVLDGDDGAGFVRQFGDDPATSDVHGNEGYADWLKLTVTGRDADGAVTGSLDVYLADYRAADNAGDYVLSDWTWMDLTDLGKVKTLEFAMDSSDSGAWGMNTPSYFAMDSLTLKKPMPQRWEIHGREDGFAVAGGEAATLVVPEPASLALLVLAAAGLRRHR